MFNARRTGAALAVAATLMAVSAVPTEAVGPKASGVGAVTEYNSPAKPWDITQGPDGNMWVTNPFSSEQVLRVTPTGVITAYPLPTTNYVLMVRTGSDGALYLSTFHGGVYRMTTAGLVTDHYDVAATGDGMALGPDGNIWVAGGGFISRLTPGGVVTDFPVDGFSLRITAGPDGALWFTNFDFNYTDGSPNPYIGRITTAGDITKFPSLPPDEGTSLPWGITTGPDGNLWFADQFDRIGRLTPTGTFTYFLTPPGGGPTDITAGPDGNLWFTVSGYARIVRMSTSGQTTGFPLPAPYSGPYDITVGPHNTIWFTEQGANNSGYSRIGVIKACGGETCGVKPK